MFYGKISTNNRYRVCFIVFGLYSLDGNRVHIPQNQKPQNMKVIIWIEEDQLDDLIKGNIVEYWEREPGIFEKVIQVTVGTDTYQKLKDSRVITDIKPKPYE